MAMEAVVFPQDWFGYGCKDLYSLASLLSYDFRGEEEAEDQKGVVVKGECEVGEAFDNKLGGGIDGFHGNWDSSPSCLDQNIKEWEVNYSSPETCTLDSFPASTFPSSQVVGQGRRKRRRTKSCKNKEEVENQRMTHIAVERNRRKQMNEYLSVLRSLMPPSYVQRGDQASIVGGAINFVKELEQLLQSLEAQKRRTKEPESSGYSWPFADFFTFPQYSSRPTSASNETVAENRSAIADIEVNMVETHANLKVLSKKRPKQLLRMVVWFESLHLTILHLNVTTIDQMVLYSFSIKVEDECKLSSIDDIATAVNQMMHNIQGEADMNETKFL